MKYTDIIPTTKELLIPFNGDNLRVVYDATKLNRKILEHRGENDFEYIDKTLNILITEWDLTDAEDKTIGTDIETLANLHSGLKNEILLAIVNDGLLLKKK